MNVFDERLKSMILSRRFGFTGDPLLCSVLLGQTLSFRLFTSRYGQNDPVSRLCEQRSIFFLYGVSSKTNNPRQEQEHSTKPIASQCNFEVCHYHSFSFSPEISLSLWHTNFNIIFEVNRQRNILYEMSKQHRLILIL